ncbi:TIM barrel protein [Amphibiibacter pelophylacis]|uniref:TIM barrel protein n=1 Tax=Amphibiibacter pelophylacis TaxID=1799477 RepID=A0ACC6NY59_9BURK
MSIHIMSAPCCWGVDDVRNPHLPHWTSVLSEASQAGYQGLELGPYGYMPLNIGTVSAELDKHGLRIVAGTIFDDLVASSNGENLIRQTHEICTLIRQLPKLPTEEGQRFAAPYLVVMDWGHDERDYAAGHSERAPRLSTGQWDTLVGHIRDIAELSWQTYGIRSVIHPHAGGYIEFADEIDRIMADIPHEVAGLCIDTGHSYYSGMDPATWLRKYAHRIDYVHFKDIDRTALDTVLAKRIRFFEACGEGVMCPIGQGALNYDGIRQTLADIGYQGYITVEQERDPCNKGSVMNDVRASRDFLRSVGFN